ncbi:SDR family NAD(P)-dependent oxidoreductase [Tunturibacter empetritectus]|uniref:SDR family NAD(P)-dependent oxidoreductase n=1 Tax=Tunturiibacter empetritectus TaxID=3069691 RepID=A0A7W8MS91_9BACT|nr:SDR family NAD(P)-dependent oxidoreductase [Edaphobacter lichenicola]MBB5318433.1 hypothetical protein [Edaphobacter lichenicola]
MENNAMRKLTGYLIMKLRSNTILITGGASGIGYELTKQLTALGNTILITGRDQAKMDRAKAAFPKIRTFRSDVSDPEAIATLYEKVTNQRASGHHPPFRSETRRVAPWRNHPRVGTGCGNGIPWTHEPRLPAFDQKTFRLAKPRVLHRGGREYDATGVSRP